MRIARDGEYYLIKVLGLPLMCLDEDLLFAGLMHVMINKPFPVKQEELKTVLIRITEPGEQAENDTPTLDQVHKVAATERRSQRSDNPCNMSIVLADYLAHRPNQDSLLIGGKASKEK